FSSRTSMGVRGIKLEADDHVISMSILRHVAVETSERAAFLRMARKRRGGEEEAAGEPSEEEAADPGLMLSPERFTELEGQEDLLLPAPAKGSGKRTSAYEYRLTGRGGSGIANIEMSDRNGHVVASFPIAHRDQIMLVTDRGQLIRCPVDDIRIAGRKTQGVVLFRTEEGEKVVSVTRLADETTDGANGDAGAGDAGGGPAD